MSLSGLLVTALLLALDSVTSSSQCSTILGDRCIQRCNATSCECSGRDGQHVYQGCTQMCRGIPCQRLLCSSGTCIQSCHGCAMECTSDVGFCVQRCLSGRCQFACGARRCEQDCSAGDCVLVNIDSEPKSAIPKPYLFLLAGCFATTSVLSLLALCLSYRAMQPRRKNSYRRLINMSTNELRRVHPRRHGEYEFNENQDSTSRNFLEIPDKPV